MNDAVLGSLAFARGGVSRVDIWATPTADLWGPAWQVRIGVHMSGTYRESVATVPPLPEAEAHTVLRRLNGQVDRGGQSFTLWLNPDPEPSLP